MLLALVWTCCSRCSPPTPPVFLSCLLCVSMQRRKGVWTCLGLPMAALSPQPGWHVLGVQLKSPASLGRSSAIWGPSHLLPVSLLREGSVFLSWLPGWLSPSPELHGELVGSGEHQGLLSWGEGTLTACLGWNKAEISVLGGLGMDSFEKTWETLSYSTGEPKSHRYIPKYAELRQQGAGGVFPARSFLQLLACLGSLCVHTGGAHSNSPDECSITHQMSVPSPSDALTLSIPRRFLGVSKWGCSWDEGQGHTRIALLWHFLLGLVI